MPFDPSVQSDAIETTRRGPGPHFFCIGPSKSATTWVADHLKLHRDIWLPPIQEISYLYDGFERHRGSKHIELRWDWWNVLKRIVRNKNLSTRRDSEFFEAAGRLAAKPDTEFDLEGYRALFAPAGDKLTGDISPIYASMDVEKIRLSATVLDETSIFMIARDPVQRFWSAMSMHYRYRTFGDVDYGSLETAQAFFHHPTRRKQHFLSDILDRWHAAIGEDRLKVFFFDDIAAQPEQTYRQIVRFIGGDYRKRIPILTPAYNRKALSDKAQICVEAREWVRQAFQPELEACTERFGRYGAKWRKEHRQPFDAGDGEIAAAGARSRD